MRQGTTPIYKFKFPFSLSLVDDLLVTFKQGARLLSKHKADGVSTTNTFSFRLTQEETEMFYEGNIKGQIKILNGINVLGSTIFEVKVKPILDGTEFVIGKEATEQERILTMSNELANCEVEIDELEQEIIVEFSETYEIVHGGAVTAEEIALDASDFSITQGTNVQEWAKDADALINNATQKASSAEAQIGMHSQDIAEHISEYDGNFHLKTAEREAWNGKYAKPSNGIPKSDLSDSVKASLDKADSSIQSLDGYATEAFVNSSIATQTAYFIGTFNSVEELNAYSGTKTPNDYAFVVVYDAVVPTEVKQYDRYKWNGTAWIFEYTLNNSSFTQAQWDAINSGITSAKVAAYDASALRVSVLTDAYINDLIDTRLNALDGNEVAY